MASLGHNELTYGPVGSYKSVISERMSWINFMSISCQITLRWMPQNTFDDKSTLVQVMAWCRQAPIHYLSQCWLKSMSPYGVTMASQWVKVAPSSTDILLLLEYSSFSITKVNSLHAKFFRGNINMYLHFVSFIHTDMPKIIEVLPRIRAGLTYFT